MRSQNELRIARTEGEPMRASYLYDAVRTPFGRYGGALATSRPDDLAAWVVGEQVRRTELEPDAIDDVILGAANQSGEDNRDVARMAVLLAELPTSVPGVTVNRLCGSSVEAAIQASRAIEAGDASIVVAGGVESMSRAPWVVSKPERGYPANDLGMASTTLGWRLVNPAMPNRWTVSLGEATEQLAERYGISRERQDEFALDSHRRAQEAWDDGVYDDLVSPVPGTELLRDESIRATTSLERLAALPTPFRPNGTITAGNASPLSDGASALLLGDEAAAKRIGRSPIARIAARAAAANDPVDFGYAPVLAAERALRSAGISWHEVGAVELNEAFAAQSLPCLDAWDVDPHIVNAWGGAIALGHPLGASGGRILGTLARRMQAEGARYGLAAICIGVGQGLAVVLERVS